MRDDESAARFALVRAAFDRAKATAPPLSSHLQLCDRAVRLTVAGEALAASITEAFVHLRRPDERGGAQLAIDLWDARASAVPGLPPDVRHAAGRHWTLEDGRFAISGDGRFVSHELGASILWLDRFEARLCGWVEDADALTLRDRGRPMKMMLAIWCGDQEMQPIHAGLVARGGHGVLVSGPSGAGKSTVALACLEAGCGFAGDDWIVLRRDGEGFTGYGLYASAFLEPSHAARFPSLAREAIPSRGSADPKSLLLLGRDRSHRLLAAAAVRAIALPRLVPHRPSDLRRASKREAMLMLAPSSIFALRPRGDRAGFARLAQLVDRVPAYWLEIGDDVAEIPARLDAILADVGRG